MVKVTTFQCSALKLGKDKTHMQLRHLPSEQYRKCCPCCVWLITNHFHSRHSLSDPTYHYNHQQRNNNPRNQYKQGYNDEFAYPYQRQGVRWIFVACNVLISVVAPSQMQWESIPRPPTHPSWSGSRDRRQQQDSNYQHYNSYPTPPQQSSHQYQPYQQQYRPYQQQWEGYSQQNNQYSRTNSWNRHQY